MAQQVLEGTWEEIAAHADELAGKRLKVIVETDVLANEQMLGILRDIAGRQEGTMYTSRENTQELTRQARNGGMYGLGPVDS